MPAEPVLRKRARPGDAEVRVADRIEGLIGKVRAAIDKVLDRLVGLVTGFIGSISAAAARVEAMLAGVLTLAISFLAGFAGLDKLVDKITGSIEKVRSAVDKAIDWLVGILTSMAKNMIWNRSITRMRKSICEKQSTKAGDSR